MPRLGMISPEVRKAKVAAKKPVKAPVKAKPVAKPKPVAKKPVAKKPVAKPVAKKPVAKPPAKPVAKPVAKKPVAKPAVKPAAKPAAPKKPAAKPAAPATTAAKKPVSKPAALQKKPATTAAKKPVAKPAAKKPATTTAKKPVAKPAAKPATTAAKKPVAKPAAKKPATRSEDPDQDDRQGSCQICCQGVLAIVTISQCSLLVLQPAASACPIKPAAKKTAIKAVKAKAKRMLDTVTCKVRIANRTFFGLIQTRLTSGNEFVGWHGTNEETAALWEKSGEIVRPTTPEGQTKGKSGLDAELGPGLYISDTLGIAEAAAAGNAKNNNLAGKVCAIFAKSSSSFRSSQDKVQIPEIIRGNADVKEQERASYITNLTPRGTGSGASLRIGPLPPLKGQSTNQMLIPESQNPKFEAQCFDTVGLDSADAQAFENANGAIKYTSASLISQWKIRQEDADLAKATVAAIEKICP
ncbi:hypothetical protein MVEN_00245500 [Mycena venus]|uniref:Uncharacterized protein n=1 Tax=Mycena venus TaxID=2733690 RepID=A0A8H6YY31_9AGAR|nr:hypothetical protein MVEN_00245500 [Mycena venus]